MPRKRKPIALDAYEKLAERYAALIDDKVENACFERPATLSLLPHVGGMRVLDAGCGSGRYVEWLVERGAEVVGVDVSPKMLRQARNRVGKRAELHLADLGRPLTFLKDRSFDLVLAPLVLDYVEDWAPLLSEFNRVLKGFGILVFSCGHPFSALERHPDANYFATGLVEDCWRGFGEPVVVPCYRRPVGAILSSLLDAGFALERFLEPQAGEEVRKRDPDAFKRRSRLPSFIAVRARKTTR
ncbi:MAG: class I SAM-dependent methyltransferase [bacterium]|jgi:SAM-dependent methyltransferase